ncbi:hypothetical protein CXB51_002202 [Gossypium anomalum]|uniref:Reverse transcriptase Ty1/copia-type domain-containing protein n=1 Tax=Gossypium anomalum TaxID=47600 RepID=A0A8J5ZJF0_9ROSI|nr:hypothetical protein CXB51_002202 [Gossypium anomalum]
MWAKAVNTAVYIQNRLPTKALEYKTPFEAWFGFKPSLAHLKVFGCLCYSLMPAIKRDKLSKKSQAGILVGYNMVKKEAVSEELMADQLESDQNGSDMEIDDEPVRGTMTLVEIYERAHMATVEPSSFEEAETHQGWKQAMADEIAMIDKNQTWELVARPAKKKARLVVKGFSQKYGLDYLETFAPVAKLDTIRLLVASAAQMKWQIHQLDVKSAFLNGFLEEEIYIEQPQGFVVSGKENMVYRLKKALYGLKQAPRAWYARIDSYLVSLGFERSMSEPTLYVKKEQAET